MTRLTEKFHTLGINASCQIPFCGGRTKNLTPKFGPNLGPNFFNSKVSIKWTHAWKIMIFKKFVDWSDFGKISKIQILPNCHQSRKKNSAIIFHAYGTIYLTLLNEKNFDPNLAKFDQILTKFWLNFGIKFFVLPPPNGIRQNALIL